MPNVSNLATVTTLTGFQNKVPSISNLVKKTDCNTKRVKLKIELLLTMIMVNILSFKNLAN